MSRPARGRAARAVAWVALGLGALAGCSASTARAAGGDRPVAAAPAAAAPVASVSGDRQIIHALSRLTYGARPGDVERVRAVGLSAWIDRQLPPRTIDDSATDRALAELTTPRMPTLELLREYPRPGPKLRSDERSVGPGRR